MYDVLWAHDDQIAAQVDTQQTMVTQHGEFLNVLVQVFTVQRQSQWLLEEQLVLIQEQIELLQTQGSDLGLKDRGPLMLKMFDGTTDLDYHINL